MTHSRLNYDGKSLSPMRIIFYILDLSITIQQRILMKLKKMFASFASKLMLKNHLKMTLPRRSEKHHFIS